MQKLWYKRSLSGWQSVLIMILLLLGYHFTQPKVLCFGMVNIENISQGFLKNLATQSLTKEEQSEEIARFGKVLEAELNHLSQEVILLDARQVVTLLPDYTSSIKENIE